MKNIRAAVVSLLFATAVIGFGQQTLTITDLPAGAVTPGQAFPIAVNATAPAGGWGGVSLTITVTNATILPGASLVASKFQDCGPVANGSVTCTVIGVPFPATNPLPSGANAAVTASGPMASFRLTAGNTGPINVTVTNPAMADPSGSSVALSGAAASIPVLAATCPSDLDGNGVTDAADLNLEISYVNKQANPPAGKTGDRNGDGKVDVADAILVLNAAIPGGSCRATQ
jgi:hypothetical protein